MALNASKMLHNASTCSMGPWVCMFCMCVVWCLYVFVYFLYGLESQHVFESQHVCESQVFIWSKYVFESQNAFVPQVFIWSQVAFVSSIRKNKNAHNSTPLQLYLTSWGVSGTASTRSIHLQPQNHRLNTQNAHLYK